MRQEKQLLLDEIYEKIEDSGAFIVTSYQGLDSLKIDDFRNKIAASGGDFEVVRKRIFVKAIEKKGLSIDINDLKGHIGVVFTGEDPIPTTKEIFNFEKDNANTLEVLAGHFDDQLVGSEKVEMLSKLPGKDAMRAQLLALFVAPLTKTLATMDALLTSIPHCLENKIQKEEQNQS
jgi:large subunit ribosomal protein L10